MGMAAEGLRKAPSLLEKKVEKLEPFRPSDMGHVYLNLRALRTFYNQLYYTHTYYIHYVLYLIATSYHQL